MAKGIPDRLELLEVVHSFQRPSNYKDTMCGGQVGGIQMSEARPVASYSWADDVPFPTIIVPGAPRTWTKYPPRKVKPKYGKQYRDQNAARMSTVNKSPLMPIFAAAEAMGNLNELKGHDIITDRNGLRKLFRWAMGTGNGNPFRIDVQLAGKTCLFTRRDPTNVERSFPGSGREYGFAYEAAATVSSDRSTSHHRIISYVSRIGSMELQPADGVQRLGDITLLVRCEVDACLGTKPSIPAKASTSTPTSGRPLFSSVAQKGLPTGQQSSSKMRMHQLSRKPAGRFSAGLTVRLSTSEVLVPQHDLIEIKTYKTKVYWTDAYPQLRLGQTQLVYTVQHTEEHFAVPEKTNVGDENNSAMMKNAEWFDENVVMLHAILEQILAVVREQGDGAALSLVQENGQLVLMKRKALKNRVVEDAVLSFLQEE
ncbi:hypothetical protein VNI00_000183 [Paramarasmius palmivorus]|uniref:Uncharacterized protein n=1 Tax=Paramarasmius palmivorus TaxID=297713 RepID=A0AAW0EES8_9AGAR